MSVDPDQSRHLFRLHTRQPLPCNTSQWMRRPPVLGKLGTLFHLPLVGATGGATHSTDAEYVTSIFSQVNAQAFAAVFRESILTILSLFLRFHHNMLHLSTIQIFHHYLGFSILYFLSHLWRQHILFPQYPVPQGFSPFKVAYIIVCDLIIKIRPFGGCCMTVSCVIWCRLRI